MKLEISKEPTIFIPKTAVIEINNIGMRTIVGLQEICGAFAFGKVLVKLQNITDGCTTKTIQTLVIISYHANIIIFGSPKCIFFLIQKNDCLPLLYNIKKF